MIVLRALLYVSIFFLFTTALYLYGPPVEKKFWPVLNVVMRVEGEDAGRLVIYLEGTKARSCFLQNSDWAWRFGKNSTMPTAPMDFMGSPNPVRPVLQLGENFVLGPFYVPIPMAVRGADNLTLTIIYYYRCHQLWLTEQDLITPIVFGRRPNAD